MRFLTLWQGGEIWGVWGLQRLTWYPCWAGSITSKARSLHQAAGLKTRRHNAPFHFLSAMFNTLNVTLILTILMRYHNINNLTSEKQTYQLKYFRDSVRQRSMIKGRWLIMSWDSVALTVLWRRMTGEVIPRVQWALCLLNPNSYSTSVLRKHISCYLKNKVEKKFRRSHSSS